MENPLHGTEESPHGTPPRKIALSASQRERLCRKTPPQSGVFLLFENPWFFTPKNQENKHLSVGIFHFHPR